MNYRALLFFTLFICSIFAINSIESIFENTGEEKLGVIVILKNDSNTKSRGISSNELNTKIQNAISKTSIKGEIRELNIINGFSTEITAEEYALLMEDNSIEGIYYDYPVYISLHQSVPIINADDVWNMQYNGKTITGKGQTVCVIDTGVDYTNPYLVGKVIGGRNVIYNNNNYMDYHGHGTHCAGIIASTHPIYTGVAPDAKIVAVKALDDDGYGSDADVIDGINWCVTNRAAYNISVISMSLGGGLSTSYCDIYDVPTSNAINAAVAQNISVVIATGNEGNYGVCYPACVQNAIRVAASTKDNLIASYSNRGGSFNDILLAPGSFIYSTIPGGIGQKSGTSMATPHIAGVIALYNQYYYDSYGYYVSPAVIEQKIINSGYIIYDSGSGKNYARVDANELFSDESLFSYSIYPHKSTYSNSENLLFEINFSEPVSNVYVNLTLPNSTTEIILLSEISSTNYNGSYIIPNQHGNYSFVYIYNYSNEIFNSHTFNFQVLYDYICVNYSDCNSSLFEYDKVLLNNSLTLNSTEFFIIDENKEFSCNNNKIFNSSYLKFIGVNSRLKDCIFYSKEFNLNSSNSFYLSNVTFRNYSEIKFNSLINNGFIISLNDKVIANTINSNANYKINKSCDGLEIDVLRLNEITNSTSDFYDSNYFTTSCVNDLIEFNSTLNGSYTYNLFNLSVTNTTGGKTNTVYNFTYLFNVTNNNIINEIFTFNYSNNLQLFNLNSSNNTLIEFNVSKNISGNYTLNYSICSNKLNRCLNSNFITEVFDIPSFNEVSIFPYVIANNSNVTFNLNVSNSKNIWFKIDLPNGSSFTDSYYAGYNYTTNQIGRHNITFYANDTFNYISEYEDYFEVLKTYISNFTFKDSEGNLTNVTLKLYYRNQQIFNFNIDNSSIGIFDLLYDLQIDFSRLRLIFENSNLTNNSFNSIYDEVKFGNYFYTLAINNSFNF